MADPGCILSVDKLVATAAHKLCRPQVHVVADSEGERGGPEAMGQGKEAGLALESRRVPTLTLECLEPVFPSMKLV